MVIFIQKKNSMRKINIRHRQQTKLSFETFSKVGRTCKAGIESDFGDIVAFLFHSLQSLIQPEFS